MSEYFEGNPQHLEHRPVNMPEQIANLQSRLRLLNEYVAEEVNLYGYFQRLTEATQTLGVPQLQTESSSAPRYAEGDYTRLTERHIYPLVPCETQGESGVEHYFVELEETTLTESGGARSAVPEGVYQMLRVYPHEIAKNGDFSAEDATKAFIRLELPAMCGLKVGMTTAEVYGTLLIEKDEDVLDKMLQEQGEYGFWLHAAGEALDLKRVMAPYDAEMPRLITGEDIRRSSN
jgi:hypothetical protein